MIPLDVTPDIPAPPFTKYAETNNPLTSDFFTHLEQVRSRPDQPYTDRPEISWQDLADHIEQLINSGCIILASNSSVTNVSYGLCQIDESGKQALTIVLPPDINSCYPHPEHTFAKLITNVYHQHLDTSADPNRLQFLANTQGLAIPDVYARNRHYDVFNYIPMYAPPNTPHRIELAESAEAISISPGYEWSSPTDLMDSVDPNKARAKFEKFRDSLTDEEKQLLFSDGDAAMGLIAVIVGIKPATILDPLSNTPPSPSFIAKTGLRYVNGAWINDDALIQTLNKSGVTFTTEFYDYFTKHLKTTNDTICHPGLIVARGIALGYGRIDAEPYAIHHIDSSQFFASGNPTPAELVAHGLTPNQAEEVVRYLKNTPGHTASGDEEIKQIMTSCHQIPSRVIDYLLSAKLVMHLGDTFITTQNQQYIDKLTQYTLKYLEDAHILK